MSCLIQLELSDKSVEFWQGDGSGRAKIASYVASSSVSNRAVIHNTAYISPNDFLVAAIGPTLGVSVAFIVMISMSVGGVFKVTITNGANTQVHDINSGVALVASSLYTFSPILVFTGDTVNFRYSVSATILDFRVLELIPS